MNKHPLIFAIFTVLAIYPTFVNAEDGAFATKRIVIPGTTVVVTAHKDAEAALSLPLSVSTITEDDLSNANIQAVEQGAAYAPNAFISQFSTRAVSNPFFRGIGGSPTNPGVSTVIDGVPQLNSYSSNLELVDIGQIEFVRGPEGALYGRNTAGGLINITSRAFEESESWRTRGQVEFGNYSRRDVRVSMSSPLWKERFGLMLSGGYNARDGFVTNDLTGNDLAGREAGFAKAQLSFKATERLNFRLILSGEHDNDGDYSLGDLDAIRSNPHHVNRDFEGYARRDVGSATFIADYRGRTLDFSSITGGVLWKSHNVTDLDYQVATFENYGMYSVRDNVEKQHQFTQEFRFSPATDRQLRLDNDVSMDWLAGVLIFQQNYKQQASNDISSIFGFFEPMPSSSVSDLGDWGMGVYGRTRFTIWNKLILTAGLRLDYENKNASLDSSSGPLTNPEASFSEVSPQFSVAWQFTPDQMTYLSASRGYKAGGFNPAPTGIPATADTESYGEERSWNYELGYKSSWFENRLETTAALFYIDWQNLQLNQQIPMSGGQYFIGNAGSANSKGLEFSMNYRPQTWWTLFGSVGYVHARFLSGSTALDSNLGENLSIAGHTLPYAPTFTANMGTQVSWTPCTHAQLYFRVQASRTGEFMYDASNAAWQSDYQIVNFRGGVQTNRWFAEGWVDNALDAKYVPMAIPYAQLGAPSGYIGENGAPVTYGVRAGFNF